MTRERLPQDLNLRADLLPLIGLPLYLMRTWHDLNNEEIRRDFPHIAVNGLALIAHNLNIGFYADYLIQNYY